MKYGFIGFGHLAQAIYQGLKDDQTISFAYISKSNASKKIPSFKQLDQLVAFSDVIWLCVKPQDLTEVLNKLENISLLDKIIVSPVAGTSIGFIENYLGENTTIVRIMPNLAVAYKKSVTAFFTNNGKSVMTQRVKNDLNKLGKVVELPEKHFDLFTAIFGSGPAFLLTILQVFKNKISELGPTNSKNDNLLMELATGTLTYFQEKHTQQSLDDLIKNITSKGGTTEAGLNYFKKNDLDKLLNNVIVAAKNRSQKIGTLQSWLNKSFIRNLTSEEIVQQVKNVLLFLEQRGTLKSKKLLFSYMGMGEPFLNYENVVESIKILSLLILGMRKRIKRS